jgi:hypothetical protein
MHYGKMQSVSFCYIGNINIATTDARPIRRSETKRKRSVDVSCRTVIVGDPSVKLPISVSNVLFFTRRRAHKRMSGCCTYVRMAFGSDPSRRGG